MDCSFEETLASLACISTVVVARGLRSTNSTPLLSIVHIHLISFAMRHVPSLGGRYWGKCCFSLKIDSNAMSVLRITFLLLADTIDVQSPTLSRGCCTQLAHLMPSHFPKATFCLLQKDFAVNRSKKQQRKLIGPDTNKTMSQNIMFAFRSACTDMTSCAHHVKMHYGHM